MLKKMSQMMSQILGTPAAGSGRNLRKPRRFTPGIETLETRLVPANIPIVVNTLLDTVNRFDGKTSLREAITTANARPGADVIRLALPGDYRITRLGSDNFNSNTFGDFDVRGSLTIIGQTAGTTAIKGNTFGVRERLFDVIGAGDMTFINLALRDGGNSTSSGGTNGGAVQALTANIKLDTCIVSGNLGLKGGAINAENGTVTLIRTLMSRNTTVGDGGAINAQNGSVVLGDSRVLDNNFASGKGGGIFTGSGTVTLSQSVVEGNRAGVDGGGISAEGGTVNLTNSSSVRFNRAGSTAPGASFGRGAGVFAATVNVVNSTVSGNIGTIGGGVFATTANVTNSTVSGNTSRREGGGILAANVTLVRSTVSGNRAEGGDGGGLFATTTANLANSTISGNFAFRNGGGVRTSNGTFLNATIVNNRAGSFGGGVFGGTANVKNTIVAANTASSQQDLAGFFTSQGNNLIGDGNGGNGATGFIGGRNDDQVGEPGNRIDPRLGALANNGGPTQTHALLAGSRAIDRGSNSGAPATDQRGVARPRDGDGNGILVVDIGAFEL